MANRWAFVLGVQKCGTTTVADLLHAQDEVFIPSIKETYFFCDEARYLKGREAWLDEYYAPSAIGGAQILCDATPFYLASEVALQRIASFAGPDARHVVILRDPVARAYSAYWHQRRNGNETLSFDDALDAEPKRIAEANAKGGRWWRHAYTTIGQYSTQLERAFDLLGRDKILILSEPDLGEVKTLQNRLRQHLDLPYCDKAPKIDRSNQAGMPRSQTLHKLVNGQNFLKRGVQTLIPREYRTRLGRKILNKNLKRDANPPMSEATRERLNAHFAADVNRLQNLGLVDVSSWLRAPKAA